MSQAKGFQMLFRSYSQRPQKGVQRAALVDIFRYGVSPATASSTGIPGLSAVSTDHTVAASFLGNAWIVTHFLGL